LCKHIRHLVLDIQHVGSTAVPGLAARPILDLAVAVASPADVQRCLPLKAQCTNSDHGRKVQRSFSIDYREKVRGYHATEAYKAAMRKRQVWGTRSLPRPSSGTADAASGGEGWRMSISRGC
jgi:GrpB-like predicted nucleotidyltransferase (UPF0157 family)